MILSTEAMCTLYITYCTEYSTVTYRTEYSTVTYCTEYSTVTYLLYTCTVSTIPTNTTSFEISFPSLRVDASQAGEGQLEISINDGEVR